MLPLPYLIVIAVVLISGVVVAVGILIKKSLKEIVDLVNKKVGESNIKLPSSPPPPVPVVNITPFKKETSIDLSSKERFDLVRLKTRLIEGFSIYVLEDRGLEEKYLILQAANGSLIGLGNLENT